MKEARRAGEERKGRDRAGEQGLSQPLKHVGLTVGQVWQTTPQERDPAHRLLWRIKCDWDTVTLTGTVDGCSPLR